MKKLLFFSIIFLFSSFTAPIFGIFGWAQPRSHSTAKTIREYLEEENKNATDALNAIQEKYMKVAEQANADLELLPPQLRIINQQAAAANIMKAMILEAAPMILRKGIVEKMCECMDDATNPTLFERDKVKNCLKSTADFIEKQYTTSDSYENKVIAVQEFKKLKKELKDQMPASHKK
jgi:hypothetical protein